MLQLTKRDQIKKGFGHTRSVLECKFILVRNILEQFKQAFSTKEKFN